MITFGKVDSTRLDLGKRIIKFFQFGAKTASESSPFGLDSNPLKDMVAIHADTSNNGESVIIGYINKNQLSEVGESRLYSVDSNGALKSFIWNKSDGKLWLNGNNHSAVRYAPLNPGLQSQKDLINVELAKIATAISSLGGVYTPSNITINISNSESQDVKLK